MTQVQLALIADTKVIPGVFVTVGSALRRIPPNCHVTIHLLTQGWDDVNKSMIVQMARRIHCNTGVRLYDFSAEEWNQLRRFRPSLGTVANYGLFIFPDRLEGRVLFLDSDLLVRLDVSPLFSLEMGNFIARAVSWEPLSCSHDKELFLNLGISLELPHYNCGVLLVECDKWREQRVSQQALLLREKFDSMLIGGNQPVLNAVLTGKIGPLERRFNTLVSAERILSPEQISQPRIWHMIGKPKPWDPLGHLVHCLATAFYEEWASLRPCNFHTHRGFLRDTVYVLRYIRKYARCIRSRVVQRYSGKSN